jgi:hypothetical protein
MPSTIFYDLSSLVPTKRSGKADLVCFGDQGAIIIRYNSVTTAHNVVSSFGYDAGGWRVDKHLRLVADITGDGTGDIIGFGERNVVVSINNGDGTFQAPKEAIQNFAYAGGWRVESHPRFVADLRRTGRADIIGFGNDGVWVSLNNGGGNFSPPSLVINNFGCNAGWRVENHPRFLADITGDGSPDIIGFGEKSVFVSLNNRDGTFQHPKPVLNNFCYNAGGWTVTKHPRFLADLTGDGRADIIGFGDHGVYVSLSSGDGMFGPVHKVLNDFCHGAGGWRVEIHPRFIADITGNGRGDIVGFGHAGVLVAINNGDGTFQPSKLAVAAFGYSSGWRVDKHPRFVADLTGNGCADIVGFGDDGVLVSFNDGSGNFGPPQTIFGNFGYGSNWRVEKHLRIPTNLPC